MEPRRWRLSPLAILGAALLGLGLALAIDVARVGSVGGWLARHHLTSPYQARGELIDVGPRRLYIDCRGEGSPTLVLEAGSGADSATWAAVIDELAAITRTCAYDRAGRGRSDPVESHTLRDATAELRALLDAAGERPRYVIVAHSLGGAYARVFADEYRDATAGLVLVDTFDPDLQAAFVHPLVGELRPEYDAGLEALWGTVFRVDSLIVPDSAAELRVSDVAGLPIEVLRAPRYEPRLDEPTNARIADAWQAAFERLSPGRVRWTTAWGAGHDVHIDRPDLVIEAVRRTVAAARGG